MVFGKGDKPLAKRGIKKMDALVTGLILGGIVASIYGIKKADEHHASQEPAHDETGAPKRHSVGSIIRLLVFGAKQGESPKPGWFARLGKRLSSKK